MHQLAPLGGGDRRRSEVSAIRELEPGEGEGCKPGRNAGNP